MKNLEKKVLIFIVEGANDEVALGMPLENLQKSYAPDSAIRLGVTHGDITSDREVSDVSHEVTKRVREYCKQYSLKKSDIFKVVHLLDMDGAYIHSDAIVQNDDYEKAFYGESTIVHISPDRMRKTHERKRRNVDKLINLKKTWSDIPYSVYFVSCNFDHVACGNANLTERSKSKAADAFLLKFGKNAEGFISFFYSPELIIGETFSASWDAIRQGLNSLHRYSNLNVFINTHYPKATCKEYIYQQDGII